MLKVCTKCGVEKTLSSFYRNKGQKSGLTPSCVSCHKAQHEKYRATAGAIELKKAYNKKYGKSYSRLNRPKLNAREAKRRSTKQNATPSWLTDSHRLQMLSVYELAKECEVLTGDKYHVDHIVPLQGETVCGLHVPWNLQVLPADINIAKGNRFGKHL
jgi:5-methylcytosine-specific restriction endonuclease McrA